MEQREQRRRLWRVILVTGLVGLAGLVYAWVAHRGFAIPCIFNRLTGLLCPGCGNTRAVLALLRLDLVGALTCNLLALPELFYVGWVYFCSVRCYLRTGRLCYRPPAPALDVCILVAILGWGIVRNII